MSHSLIHIGLSIAATRAVAWPHFAGSALRGAFGRALRKAACLTGHDHCAGCPLRNNCAYGVVFDPAAPAHPLHPSFRDGLPRYIVQPPALGACSLVPGMTQHFGLLLLPGTQGHHKLIETVLRRAVEQELFEPGQFKLLDTQVSQIPLWPMACEHASAHSPQGSALAHITLRWHHPLRLQYRGKPVFKPEQLDAMGLLRALLRRQLQWLQITGDQPAANEPTQQELVEAASASNLETRHMQWHDIQRFSGSQGQKLPMGGLVGGATLSGPARALHTLYPLLQLGERLHVGKETVMGLGRYQLGAILPG